MSQVKEKLLRKDLLGQAKRNEMTQHGNLSVGKNTIKKNDLTIRIADVWGFCYGVLYAIEAVGEVLENHPNKKVWVLGELIHNSHVNNELQNMGAEFITPQEVTKASDDDIVVVPAFGTQEEIFEYVDEQNFVTVDTTCPEVRDVEDEVKEFNKDGLTAVIHGKHEHQESIATSSFAHKYLIVRDIDETEIVCEYIKNGGDTQKFLDKFEHACSDNFDPDQDLREIGLANQTTMLMNESMEIFDRVKEAVHERDGNYENVRSIDTICSATQDRQDAVTQLVKHQTFDLFLVVGGHTSSNTKNLARTVYETDRIPVYHIESDSDLNKREIKYLPRDSMQPETEKNWLPDGPLRIGLTAGASTPHSDLEEIIHKLLEFY